jgi:DNA-binding transcriptional LysR family regulator
MVAMTAAEAGSFSRVARELGVSQPSVSRMVAALEGRLGVKLLLRTTRQVCPTDAGAVFLERARRVLGDVDDAENAARGVDSLHGALRVATPGSFGTRQVIPRLPGFLAQHPQLRVELLISDRTDDLVAEGVDMALRLGRLADSRFGALAGDGFAFRGGRAGLPRSERPAHDVGRPVRATASSAPASRVEAAGASSVREP